MCIVHACAHLHNPRGLSYDSPFLYSAPSLYHASQNTVHTELIQKMPSRKRKHPKIYTANLCKCAYSMHHNFTSSDFLSLLVVSSYDGGGIDVTSLDTGRGVW